MQHRVTPGMSTNESRSTTKVSVDGTTYWTVTGIAQQLGIARQTLWRWRRDEKVPKGRLYRGQIVLFSEEEAARIYEFANRLSPLEA